MTHAHTVRLRPALLLSLSLLGALIAGPGAAQVTITAHVANSPSPAATADIQDALNTLASDFYSATPFNMTADIDWSVTLPSNVLAASNSGSDSFQNVGNILYPNPLDRYLFGPASTVSTSGGYADFSIDFNSTFTWDYTQATPANPAAISLATVLCHEALHSMGFEGDNNANGSYGYDNSHGIAIPTVWTTHLFDAFTNQPFTADTSAQRAAVLVSSDDLLFVGANEEAQNGGLGVEMYAPSTFEIGSSDGSHIASDQPNGNLMYYSTPYGYYTTPSPLVLSMMQDIGWQLAAAPEPSDLAGLSIGIIALAGLILKAGKRRFEA